MADDCNVPQALLDITGRPDELCVDLLDVAAQVDDLARLIRKNCGHVLSPPAHRTRYRA
jgi:hypothetical protein